MAIEIHKAHTKLIDQLRVEVSARQHTMILDEPKSMGSSDKGMTPIEALMGALGACKCIVARSFAEQHGVELKSVEVSVEGEFDPDGFLGKNPEAKIGFSAIRSIYHIESDSPKENIEKLVAFVDKTCPVADTLENSPKMQSKINIK